MIVLQMLLAKSMVYADIVTTVNLSLGLLAIISVLSGFSMVVSYSLVLLAILADGLDGVIARITGQGIIGSYLEAMADMVSLSVAPTILVYHSYTLVVQDDLIIRITLVIFLLIFNITSFLRLGFFHIIKDETTFVGLPVSACTIILANASIIKPSIYILGLVILLISYLMISKIRFPKISKKTGVISAVIIIMVMILGLSYSLLFSSLLLSVVILFYIIGGPIYLSISRKSLP
ncbi:MAG: hypothetical protein QXS02_04125 [Candidatus Thermoplasmatota archaeon]